MFNYENLTEFHNTIWTQPCSLKLSLYERIFLFELQQNGAKLANKYRLQHELSILSLRPLNSQAKSARQFKLMTIGT